MQQNIPKGLLFKNKVVSLGMFTRWIIDLNGFELYRFGEDKELYRLPFNKGKRSYGFRKIKKAQDRNRWKINGVWWSENQLRQHIKIDTNQIEITKTNDLPF